MGSQRFTERMAEAAYANHFSGPLRRSLPFFVAGLAMLVCLAYSVLLLARISHPLSPQRLFEVIVITLMVPLPLILVIRQHQMIRKVPDASGMTTGTWATAVAATTLTITSIGYMVLALALHLAYRAL